MTHAPLPPARASRSARPTALLAMLLGTLPVALTGCVAAPSAGDTAAQTANPAPPREQRIVLDFERLTDEQRARARQVLTAELAAMGIAAQESAFDTADFPGITPRGGDRQGVNLIARIPATAASDRHIVLGAHYDTVAGSPGVDDNGSGVHVLLGVAAALAAMPERTAHVHVVFYDLEEIGLVGARVHAERWRQSGQALEAMHNVDMVGWDSDDDGVIELDSSVPAITRLYEDAVEGLPLALLVTSYPNTDHQAYRERGFKVASISQEFEDETQNPDYHGPGDTSVEWDYLGPIETMMVRVFTRLVAP